MTNSKPCSVDGCDREVKTRGWCSAHHQRVLKYGDPGPAAVRKVNRQQAKACTVEGCPSPLDSYGFCKPHYRRWRETGDPGPLRDGAAPPPPCAVEGCDRPASTKGWCRGHYSRWWSKGDPGGPDLRPFRTGCQAGGCSRPHSSSGYCELHYRRMRRGVAEGSLMWLAEPTWNPIITYPVLHSRLRAERGSARTHPCVGCDAQAQDWAYQHNDPDALEDERGYLYSLDIYGSYAPMCRSCHNTLDRDLDERASRLAADG